MAPPTLGDCLLHLEHHEMTQECWRRTVEFFLALAERGEVDTGTERDLYKAAYERAATDKLIEEVSTWPQVPSQTR